MTGIRELQVRRKAEHATFLQLRSNGTDPPPKIPMRATKDGAALEGMQLQGFVLSNSIRMKCNCKPCLRAQRGGVGARLKGEGPLFPFDQFSETVLGWGGTGGGERGFGACYGLNQYPRGEPPPGKT